MGISTLGININSSIVLAINMVCTFSASSSSLSNRNLNY